MVKQSVNQQVDSGSNPTPSLQESHDDCKYLGNDLWDCGHIDNSTDGCDCHVCVTELINARPIE